MFTLGIVGAGQFAGSFAKLWQHHPGVGDIRATDLLPERAARLAADTGLAGTLPSFEALLDSDIDAVAIFTQRWTHGPLVVQALRAGKHVYSAVPMAVTADEIAAIVDAVRETGLTYMMGETAHYNPAAVYARQRAAQGAFGRLFYAEGDYVHDMDLGFYEAYQYSGGENWKATASFPPLLYPTHAVGGVLGAWQTHAVSVSAIGVTDDRGDGVFDREVSQFDNDFSNATALFEVAGGGSFRTNEFRRVGYPSHILESRYRFFGTQASLEQVATVSLWQDRTGVQDVTLHLRPVPDDGSGQEGVSHVAPALREAFLSGYAPVHDRTRLPAEFAGVPNGHFGSHHYLADDFVTAVTTGTLPPVNAWVAARYTLPGIVAHQSALNAGRRLPIPDFGAGPKN
ncbi:Gfo/Idh/MocA family protein [Actinacidiphila bryophytorum]|uniref:Oxidoreductase n=1 Tax=Actinacidiphila bryophytorum TaxID=1436133 RepID=A0A9W4GWI1_9ACTN|nr:Gfo/Idh/MocA family oxidoreductase [Actinacidiphila bryophytorum]MBM9435309.1 Gfo/Idh/MocA family oxidoreductase [Actinacidiphila bryophytorum]CAG7606638.1 Oxidoreductase [Actinacidiphila bryophytorum]